MKRLIYKLPIYIFFIFHVPLYGLACPPAQKAKPVPPPPPRPKIQLCLLLDTSNSMDGLIEQAKSQLWNMVNTLSLVSYRGDIPDLQIALYEYGNKKLSADNGYIRRIVGLGNDFDKISEELFNVTISGGQEYCGWAILSALQQEEWSTSDTDLKLILIAGNEPFTQGKIRYTEACDVAKSKGVSVNTIHCGQPQEGIATKWQDAAELANGKFFNINQDQKTTYTESPFDDEILELSSKLNDTYIPLGTKGIECKERQHKQDIDAVKYNKVNGVNRAIAKCSVQYVNSSWDLVDAVSNKTVDLSKLSVDNLPNEMQAITPKECQQYVEKKMGERRQIRAKVNELDKKRRDYLAQLPQEDTSLMLDQAIVSSIEGLALISGYDFEK